jgi:hypothetical protein
LFPEDAADFCIDTSVSQHQKSPLIHKTSPLISFSISPLGFNLIQGRKKFKPGKHRLILPVKHRELITRTGNQHLLSILHLLDIHHKGFISIIL